MLQCIKTRLDGAMLPVLIGSPWCQKPSPNWLQVKIYLFKGFYECNECETGYDKGKGNYCLDIDECYTVGCDDYDEGLELLCTNTEGLKRLKVPSVT